MIVGIELCYFCQSSVSEIKKSNPKLINEIKNTDNSSNHDNNNNNNEKIQTMHR